MTSCMLWLCLTAPAQPPFAAPAPSPLDPGPIVSPAPIVVGPGPVGSKPMSVCEFAQCFQPHCGTHNVCLLHPKKCCPVNVCFTLPPGDPCVKVNKHSIVFDYGCKKVKIQFGLFCCRAWVVYC